MEEQEKNIFGVDYSISKDTIEKEYQELLIAMNEAKGITDFEKVKKGFLDLEGYKDSVQLAATCKREEERLKDVEKLYYAKELAKENAPKAKPKTILITAFIVVAIVSFLTIRYLLPVVRYNRANKMTEEGNYIAALNLYSMIGDYKDTYSRIKELVRDINIELSYIASANEGDTVYFGEYLAANEWIILEKNGDKVLIISKYPITEHCYNNVTADVYWEFCSLRQWLNGDFLNQNFGTEEMEYICTTQVINEDNDHYPVEAGRDTSDMIFLLSANETLYYFPNRSDRKVDYDFQKNVNWWLRTPGEDESKAAYVGGDGSVNYNGMAVGEQYVAVRPAMWIDISEFK